jgi:hypothetical protein
MGAPAEAAAAALRYVAPHSYTHIFAMGLIFAAADAFGIGSNDVANSFATSVGSGSLSLKGACFIAVFTEFTGAMVLGEHVTKTIKGAGARWRGAQQGQAQAQARVREYARCARNGDARRCAAAQGTSSTCTSLTGSQTR